MAHSSDRASGTEKHPLWVPFSVVVMLGGVVLCEVSHHRGGLTVLGLMLLIAGMVWWLLHLLRRRHH